MIERTLAIIKPDGVERGLIGEVIKRMEAQGFRIVAMKLIRMSLEQARGFYKEHEGKHFYESVTKFMSSGPCVVMVLEGEGVIEKGLCDRHRKKCSARLGQASNRRERDILFLFQP